MLSRQQKTNHGEREMYFVPGSNDAIISPELFKRAQVLRQKRSLGKAPVHSEIISQIRCICGARMRFKYCNYYRVLINLIHCNLFNVRLCIYSLFRKRTYTCIRCNRGFCFDSGNRNRKTIIRLNETVWINRYLPRTGYHVHKCVNSVYHVNFR